MYSMSIFLFVLKLLDMNTLRACSTLSGCQNVFLLTQLPVLAPQSGG